MLGLKQPPIELDCTESVLELVKGDTAPDICGYDFFALKEAGMVAAFEPTELMKEDMAAMPQYLQDVLRDNLMTEDGKLSGYLDNLDVQPLGFYVPDAWEASPYRDMTPPSSVEEILDFLEIYLETPHDGFCFIHDATDGWWGRLWVVTLLMRCWAIQSNYAKIPLRYNNPEFIRLLERTVDLFNRLLKVEKGRKNQKGRQLFQDNLFSRGPTGNNLDTITYASLIPWRLTKDQPPLIHVMADFYCVRTGSPYEDRAAELLERIIPGREAYCSREIRPLIYEFINPDRVDVEGFNKMILKKLGGKYSWKLVTQEFIDSIWDIHKYAVPAIVPDDYQNLNDHINENPEALFRKLLDGEVTAADFAAKWDEMNHWAEPAQ
ncbi:hypothetical protein [Aristaeella hokkaidonensis]|uniref:Uncharacterized protein n=2 Tax=Aristaeella hokkaidonensis TaxID=3046382 RepID=A0AC61N695_9FIRM|nr:hypothetical protein [Aristaeella hokkaidonensis]QUC65996.1 hypothetical protein JYE49_08920 [Aristaeella hokkaidonensis]